MSESRQPPEDVALAPEHRGYILDVFARLKSLSHYELLGIARDADERAVKRAYFQLARIIHPDRYFGKSLGSYKPKLDAIFARATKAYQILTTSNLRAAYDATLGSDRPAQPAPIDPATAGRRQAVLEALQQRSADGKANAAPHVAAAVHARSVGDVTAAAEAYRRALAFTPNDVALQGACEEMEQIAAERKRDAHRRQAGLAERQGRWAQAAASWKIVAELSPDDSDARAHLAQALAKTEKPR